jgi:DNA mismatch repair ATPase MutS
MVSELINKLRDIVDGFNLVRECYHGMKTDNAQLTEAQEWLHLELKDYTSAAESSLYRETFFAVKEFFESATEDEIPDEYKELIDALRENYKEYLSIERKDLRITSFSQKGHERNRYFSEYYNHIIKTLDAITGTIKKKMYLNAQNYFNGRKVSYIL